MNQGLSKRTKCWVSRYISLGEGKNCDKLIAYTSVFAAVTESRWNSHVIRKVGLQILLAGLQMALMGRFCKFQKQNRELPYASRGGQAG